MEVEEVVVASTSADFMWKLTDAEWVPADCKKETTMKTTTVAEVHAVTNGWLVEDMNGDVAVATTIKEVCELVKEATEAAEGEE